MVCNRLSTLSSGHYSKATSQRVVGLITSFVMDSKEVQSTETVVEGWRPSCLESSEDTLTTI